MIKEHIENLPGGKEYIIAQITIGMASGVLVMLSMVLIVANIYAYYGHYIV